MHQIIHVSDVECKTAYIITNLSEKSNDDLKNGSYAVTAQTPPFAKRPEGKPICVIFMFMVESLQIVIWRERQKGKNFEYFFSGG